MHTSPTSFNILDV